MLRKYVFILCTYLLLIISFTHTNFLIRTQNNNRFSTKPNQSLWKLKWTFWQSSYRRDSKCQKRVTWIVKIPATVLRTFSTTCSSSPSPSPLQYTHRTTQTNYLTIHLRSSTTTTTTKTTRTTAEKHGLKFLYYFLWQYRRPMMILMMIWYEDDCIVVVGWIGLDWRWINK